MERLPAHLRSNAATNWLGPARHILHYPVRRGEVMNIVAFVERDDWQIESWTERGTHDELADDFRGWHADVHTIFRHIDEPFKWALMIRPAMARWSNGRVTLLGDACHPTLPFLGQGAVMAIEDAYVLAGAVAKHADDHAAAFAHYEAARRERTAAIVARSIADPAKGGRPRLRGCRRRRRAHRTRMEAGTRHRALRLDLPLRRDRGGELTGGISRPRGQDPIDLSQDGLTAGRPIL